MPKGFLRSWLDTPLPKRRVEPVLPALIAVRQGSRWVMTHPQLAGDCSFFATVSIQNNYVNSPTHAADTPLQYVASLNAAASFFRLV